METERSKKVFTQDLNCSVPLRLTCQNRQVFGTEWEASRRAPTKILWFSRPVLHRSVCACVNRTLINEWPVLYIYCYFSVYTLRWFSNALPSKVVHLFL